MSDQLTWEASYEYCLTVYPGAYLAEIKDTAEYDLMQQFYEECCINGFFWVSDKFLLIIMIMVLLPYT